MSERSADNETFEIVRTYDAAPAGVFAAWADAEAKASWFGPPGARTFEFEVEGASTSPPAAPTARATHMTRSITTSCRMSGSSMHMRCNATEHASRSR